MNCSQCDVYTKTKGKGSKRCLTCEQYKQFNNKYSDRPSIKFVKLPDEILENIEDLNAGMPDVITAIRNLDPEQSTLLSDHYIIGLTEREIASLRGVSPGQIHKQIVAAVEALKIYLCQ